MKAQTIHVFAPIDPGRLAINKARRAGVRGGVPYTYATKEATGAVLTLSCYVSAAAHGRCIATGPIHVSITLGWPRKRRTGPAAGYPMGDVDAPIKSILDACTRAGVWTDDAQVISLAVSSFVAEASDGPCITLAIMPLAPRTAMV